MLAISIVFFLMFLFSVVFAIWSYKDGCDTFNSVGIGCGMIFAALFSLICGIFALLDYCGKIDSTVFFETIAEAATNTNL